MRQVLVGDRLAIARQAVEEHFPEVDGLVARDQALRCVRRPVKAEMPQHGVGLHLVPRLETGDGDVENHHAARRLRMESSQRVGDHAPVIVAGDIGLLQREMARQLVNVFRERCRIVAVERRCRPSDATEIDREYGEGADEPSHDSAKY